MKIRLLTPLSGTKGSFAYGDSYECLKDEAERFVIDGLGAFIGKDAKKKTKELFDKINKKQSLIEMEKELQDKEDEINAQYNSIAKSENDLKDAKAILEELQSATEK